jgi:hypothetical protein
MGQVLAHEHGGGVGEPGGIPHGSEPKVSDVE